MSRFSCIIQEGSAADEQRAELEARLTAHHQAFYPGEEVAVGFMAVPDGFMFTEGRPSTSSVIACLLQHETTLDQREPYMRGICDLWSAVTGCTDHEIVVSVTDAATARSD